MGLLQPFHPYPHRHSLNDSVHSSPTRYSCPVSNRTEQIVVGMSHTLSILPPIPSKPSVSIVGGEVLNCQQLSRTSYILHTMLLYRVESSMVDCELLILQGCGRRSDEMDEVTKCDEDGLDGLPEVRCPFIFSSLACGREHAAHSYLRPFDTQVPWRVIFSCTILCLTDKSG